MSKNFSHPDVLPGEKVVYHEEILTPKDPSLSASYRPPVEDAIESIRGVISGWEVPFAAGTLPHHHNIEEQNLYTCLFGRDALIIARFLYPTHTHFLSQAVQALGAFQGHSLVAASEEEPGRIPHEVRDSTDSRGVEISKGSGWVFPYYGSVDATPLWLTALTTLASGSIEMMDKQIAGRTLWERAEAATTWLLSRLDADGGVLRSRRSNPHGILNQVWKDSGDSYMDKSGRVATQPGTASVETIGETVDALHSAAWLAAHSPHRWAVTPADLTLRATTLRDHLLDSWWMGDFFAMGHGVIEGRETFLDALASNQWRLLDSQILDHDDAAHHRTALIDSVTDPDILGPHGLRTLAASHPRYRPGGYHTGSSWPMDTATIIRGLIRHGARAEARELASLTLRAITHVGGYPELFRSDESEPSGVSRWTVDIWDDAIGGPNRVSQPPQMLQGWTIAAYHWLSTAGFTATDRRDTSGPKESQK